MTTHSSDENGKAAGNSAPVSLAVLIVSIGVFLLMVGIAMAQNAPPQGRNKSGPPPEALAACESKAESDACSMTIPRRDETVQGRCVVTKDKQLACLPDGAPPPR